VVIDHGSDSQPDLSLPAGIVNLTSCIRILNRSMEHNAFMLSSEHTSPGPKP